MNKKNLIMILTMAIAILGFSGLSLAATATNNMTVSGTVNASCTIDAVSAVPFPAYSGAAVQFQNTVDITCSVGTPYTVALSTGANASGCQRRATNGTGGYLRYNLFRDTELMNDWGNGTTCGTSKAGTGTGGATTHTVYGQVPVQTVPPMGAYSDTITVTVNY